MCLAAIFFALGREIAGNGSGAIFLAGAMHLVVHVIAAGFVFEHLAFGAGLVFIGGIGERLAQVFAGLGLVAPVIGHGGLGWNLKAWQAGNAGFRGIRLCRDFPLAGLKIRLCAGGRGKGCDEQGGGKRGGFVVGAFHGVCPLVWNMWYSLLVCRRYYQGFIEQPSRPTRFGSPCMHIVANNSEFDIDENTSLLQALRQHGIAANFSCRNGNCGLCEAYLNSGRVWLDDSEQFIDAPTNVLLCRAFARCDLTLKIDIAPRAVSRYCRVLSIEKIAGRYQLRLQLPAGRIPEMQPGDAVRLENCASARLLTSITLAMEGSQRILTLQLFDDDREWLDAASASDGVCITLPVAAP